jgi:hypothetical protein
MWVFHLYLYDFDDSIIPTFFKVNLEIHLSRAFGAGTNKAQGHHS